MDQRLSEIGLNEWPKVDWSLEDVGDVRLPVLAINRAIARLVYKVNKEAEHSWEPDCVLGCLDGMARLPDECVPFTLTRPPYDNLRTLDSLSD